MQLRNICFTLNNYTQDEYRYILELDIFKYLVVGKEISKDGTPHLQGYGMLKNRIRFNKLKSLCSRWHIESRKGTHAQASDYCKKEGDYVEIGDPPVQGKRNDLEEVAEKLKSGVGTTTIAQENTVTYIRYYRGIEQTALKLQTSYEHTSVRGIWIWGPPGTGKSWTVRSSYSSSLYVKPQNKWWDGYNGELTVLLDDLDSPCLSHYLKIWADRYACTGETKGGTIHLRYHRFIVTSNYHPASIFPTLSANDCLVEAIARRFTIIEKDSIDTPINI